LKKPVASVNALDVQPDFIVFTGAIWATLPTTLRSAENAWRSSWKSSAHRSQGQGDSFHARRARRLAR